jgi:hypothetical protein
VTVPSDQRPIGEVILAVLLFLPLIAILIATNGFTELPWH